MTTNVLKQREQEALLDQPDVVYPVEHRNLVILRLGLHLGLRLSEQIALRWDDVDLSTGKTLVKGDKKRKSRSVFQSDELLEIVVGWKTKQNHEWEKRTLNTNKGNSPGYVVTDLQGNRLSRHYIRNMVTHTASEAGIQKEVRYKTLRNTFGRNVFKRTGNIKYVQNVMGHENMVTTMVSLQIVPPELQQVWGDLREKGMTKQAICNQLCERDR